MELAALISLTRTGVMPSAIISSADTGSNSAVSRTEPVAGRVYSASVLMMSVSSADGVLMVSAASQ